MNVQSVKEMSMHPHNHNKKSYFYPVSLAAAEYRPSIALQVLVEGKDRDMRPKLNVGSIK